ncbi:MAG: zinc-binding dehydrogenase [Planctomycetales bacterium]|nr:zinc-binding dehydrogenase [Planctomycetales bacterium]NIM08575.1 zinc-binding dehydrogenase [Planctomycetales bacterium]NIN08044.1 zinc-binding dehydrogenase [Planctomycetales bacterium]NIN77180.1 zinc-binding dehydrogenase [Planctomycetales bacterium]NIO34362.1 zinc-binding dehydrogenase [Planctomycetales bacterium]
MKAAYLEETGPPEVIHYGDLPKPQPQAGQLLVKVAAVSVNPIDTYIRGGADFFKLPLPYIVGCDLAGTVEAVGPAVTRFKVGDRVWGSNQGLLGRQGTFAQYAAVDPSWLYPTPENVRDEEAAAIALVGITAHLGLFDRAKLRAGELLFINGGSGGVGSTVIQMAKIVGAQVITTAGSDAKVAICRALGADHAINYKTTDVAAAVRRVAPQGVDVYWETVRQPDLLRAVEMLAPAGRLILMAGRDAEPKFPVGPFYVKGCSMHGFVMFAANPTAQREAASDIHRWLAEGRLHARIDRVLPLAETAAAHRLQEQNTIGQAGTLAGKIVLKP